MTDVRTDACPACGDTHAGYEYEMTETHVMCGSWGETAEAGGTNWVARQSLVKCSHCGARFQYDALNRRGFFGGSPREPLRG